MLNSKSYNKNTAVQASGYNQAKRLQETGFQKGKFNWNSKTDINSFLGTQLTHASNLNNFQSVLTFHRFTKATTNISLIFFPKITNEGNIHSRSIEK